MSNQSGAVRNPANDLTSFDISKRSPEQIAALFARWKEQRKHLQAAPAPIKSDGRAGHRPARTEASASHEQKVPPTASVREPKRAGAIAYTTDFAAVLAAGEALPAPEVKAPWRPPLAPAPLPEVKRGRSSKAQWALAGIASAVVATAVYGAMQWQKQEFASVDANANGAIAATSEASRAADAEARPQRPAMQESAPLLPAAVLTPAAEATELQQVIDAALLRAGPADDAAGAGTEIAHPALTPILKPPVGPAVDPVHTASTPAIGAPVGKPIELSTIARSTPILNIPFGATASDQSRGATVELTPIGPPLPIGRGMTSAGRATIELDQVIGAGGTEESEADTASDGWPSSLDERGGDRPVRSGSLDGGVARAGDEGTSGGTGGDTGSASGGTGTGGTGTGSGSDPGDGTGGSGTGSGDGSGGGDTGGGGTGGDTGGDPGGGDTGGGDTGGGDTGGGDPGGGDTGGGDTGGGDTGGGDTGGGDPGGGDTGGGDTGGGDTGGGDTGGGDTGGGGGDTGGGGGDTGGGSDPGGGDAGGGGSDSGGGGGDPGGGDAGGGDTGGGGDAGGDSDGGG